MVVGGGGSGRGSPNRPVRGNFWARMFHSLDEVVVSQVYDKVYEIVHFKCSLLDVNCSCIKLFVSFSFLKVLAGVGHC